MKIFIASILVCMAVFAFGQQITATKNVYASDDQKDLNKQKTQNVILVTFDGYRWQEMFGGAQKKVYKDKKYGKEIKKMNKNFIDKDPIKSREILMPFIWGTIAKKGQIYGNKKIGNKVTLTNGYKFSFPGYNEILSGWGDKRINSNGYGDDPNTNIFDFLKSQPGFEGKLAAFGTWDAFPRIINVKRNNVPVFVNCKTDKNGGFSSPSFKVDKWLTTIPAHNMFAKEDTFTYQVAKEYLARNHPRFAFIGFDETDDYAHDGNYAAYLATANTLDNYMQDLWEFIQSDPQYKDNTTIIITCDHGRGDIPKLEWRHHGHVMGAEYIWIAAMGPNIAPKGEIKDKVLLHQNQIAATVCALMGFNYTSEHFVGASIKLILNQ